MITGKHASQKGFTLIELLIVIVLIAILSISAYARFFNISEKSHDVMRIKIVADIEAALMMYEANSLLKTGIHSHPDQLDDADVGSASEANSFFVNIMTEPGVTSGWVKLGENLYQPAGVEMNNYRYYPDTGKFTELN